MVTGVERGCVEADGEGRVVTGVERGCVEADGEGRVVTVEW